jgi:hypothetical protein
MQLGWNRFSFGAILRVVWILEKKDTVRSFKEVAASVYLDPWRAGNCPVCFG